MLVGDLAGVGTSDFSIHNQFLGVGLQIEIFAQIIEKVKLASTFEFFIVNFRNCYLEVVEDPPIQGAPHLAILLEAPYLKKFGHHLTFLFFPHNDHFGYVLPHLKNNLVEV